MKKSTTITCPNCRLPTENVICTKNLPENDGVFQGYGSGACPGRNGFVGGCGPSAGGIGSLNSPYEAAKRLARESESLLATDQRFLAYLSQME